MKTIQLRTEIPGPKSKVLLARREAAIPRGPSLVSSRCLLRSPKVRGSKMWTEIVTSILRAVSAA